METLVTELQGRPQQNKLRLKKARWDMRGFLVAVWPEAHSTISTYRPPTKPPEFCIRKDTELSTGVRTLFKVLPHTGKPEMQLDRRMLVCVSIHECTATDTCTQSNHTLLIQRWKASIQTSANRAAGINTHRFTHTDGWLGQPCVQACSMLGHRSALKWSLANSW